MPSSVPGIGAAISALLWIGVLSFIVLAWIDDRRRGFVEQPREPPQRDKRRTMPKPPADKIEGIDLADVDGVDLMAPPPMAPLPDVDALTWSALTATDPPRS